MSAELQQTILAPRIAGLLSQLRLRIRGYVWAEGIGRSVVALGIAFWSTLVFDWLFEPPWQFRAVMLAAVGVAIAYVAYRYILHRAFRPLGDNSLALLLERRFRDYRDSLLTTVELSRRSDHAAAFNEEMLAHTRDEALARSERIRLADVFQVGPLVRTLAAAIVLACSILGFAVVARAEFNIWFKRVVLLDRDLLWPRNNHVRVQGFGEDRRVKVAKGSDFELVAVADATEPFRLPATVEVRYRTDEGIRGRDTMSTVGSAGPRDAQQKYSYFFKGITSSIDFDVYGGDDRDRGFRLEVVDNPAISKMELACEYPGYTGRAAGTVPASGLVQLPQGTKVTIHCQANKDLIEVPVTMVQGEKASSLGEIKSSDGDRRAFSVSLPELMQDTTLLFELHDADGVRSREPVRLNLTAVSDEAPAVALRLRGISTAVTPQARLSAVGDLRDDYGLTRIWFDYRLSGAEAPASEGKSEPQSIEQNFRTSTLARDGRPKTQLTIDQAADEALDLDRLQQLSDVLRHAGVKTPEEVAKLTLPEELKNLADIKTQAQLDQILAFQPKAGQKLFVAFKAADNCALPAGINIGQGERYQLDVVPPEQLLSMLEGRELMLRRRFEVIYQEMQDTRDALARVNFKPPDAAADAKSSKEPGEDATESAKSDQPAESPEQRATRLAKRARELREVRVNRALDNSARSASETLGVAESFDDIREEMVNNRIDTPEVQIRLKDQIADPLRQIANEMFPVLKGQLQELHRSLDEPGPGQRAVEKSVSQADAILVKMKQVLDKMLELETYNEVVEQLRQIIAGQAKLSEETVRQQKEALKKKLRDLEN